MRQARIKPSEVDTFMHLYNRVAGHVGEFPFGLAEKEFFSRFMKDLQQQFTRWFNRTRPIRRRGHLWQERFKNTILEGGLSVWHCEGGPGDRFAVHATQQPTCRPRTCPTRPCR